MQRWTSVLLLCSLPYPPPPKPLALSHLQPGPHLNPQKLVTPVSAHHRNKEEYHDLECRTGMGGDYNLWLPFTPKRQSRVPLCPSSGLIMTVGLGWAAQQ